MTDKDKTNEDAWAQFIQQQAVRPFKSKNRIAPEPARKWFKKPNPREAFSIDNPIANDTPFDSEFSTTGQVWWQRSSLRPQEIEKLKKGAIFHLMEVGSAWYDPGRS